MLSEGSLSVCNTSTGNQLYKCWNMQTQSGSPADSFKFTQLDLTFAEAWFESQDINKHSQAASWQQASNETCCAAPLCAPNQQELPNCVQTAGCAWDSPRRAQNIDNATYQGKEVLGHFSCAALVQTPYSWPEAVVTAHGLHMQLMVGCTYAHVHFAAPDTESDELQLPVHTANCLLVSVSFSHFTTLSNAEAHVAFHLM